MEKLKNLLIKENKKQLKKAFADLRKAKKSDMINLWYYNEKLTKKQFEKLNKNEITVQEVRSILKNKIEAEHQKRLEKDIARIETIKNADDDITQISICIDWARSSTWGYNPHAVIITNKGTTTEGRACGCGYDKESASIAEALNKNNDILKLLYTAKNKKMTLKKHDNHEILGYGSGYGVLPYFEGGVGVSSLLNIFKKLKYNVIESHTKTTDFYTISKGAR